MTTMTMDQSDGTWSITTRVIVYAAIGAALYAVFNFISFGFVLPGTQEVNVRPHYGLLTFFGFAFGPVVGFLTGLIGNIVGDFLSGYGAFTSWHWSLANGVAGLLAGVFGVVLRRPCDLDRLARAVGGRRRRAGHGDRVHRHLPRAGRHARDELQRDPDDRVLPGHPVELDRRGHRDADPGVRVGAAPGAARPLTSMAAA